MAVCLSAAGTVLIGVLPTVYGQPGTPEQTSIDQRDRRINVRRFEHLVKDGDWSPAIQAAIDRIDRKNGFHRGAVVFFPAGRYRIDRTITLGEKKAHWGVQLLGYGAEIVGSKTLDARDQSEAFEQRADRLTGNKRVALEDDRDLDPALLELYNPPGTEGAGFVIEGLTFTRDEKQTGIGIKVPAGQVPKGTTFRSVHVFRQAVGIHVNYAWQMYFSDCILRSNRVGLHGQNHFNAVSIVNTTFRRNQHHGLQIGPDRKQWGSSGINVTGSIFEANKGYGVYNINGVQTTISGTYFEANGNSIYITAPAGHTTVDTCHFWRFYPAEWNIAEYEGKGHVVIKGTKNVQLRNNRYGKGTPIFLAGSLRGDRNRFDAHPEVAEKADLSEPLRIAADGGLSFYEFDADAGTFHRKSLIGTEKK